MRLTKMDLSNIAGLFHEFYQRLKPILVTPIFFHRCNRRIDRLILPLFSFYGSALIYRVLCKCANFSSHNYFIADNDIIQIY